VESVIRIKATRPRKLAEELRQKGYDEFVLGTRLCLPGEKIIRGEMPESATTLPSFWPGGGSEALLCRRGPGEPGSDHGQGKRLLEEADLVIFAGSLVNPALLEG